MKIIDEMICIALILTSLLFFTDFNKDERIIDDTSSVKTEVINNSPSDFPIPKAKLEA